MEHKHLTKIGVVRNNYRGRELGPVLVAAIATILFWIFIVYDAYKTAKEINSQI